MRTKLNSWLVAALMLHQASALARPPADGIVPERMRTVIGEFLGDYRGNWNTELTESEVDDISRYDLSDSVMRLSLDADHRLGVTFYLDPGAAAANQPLDLLGYGCNSKVGKLLDLDQRSAADGTAVTRATFGFDWGRCPNRVHSVAGTTLQVELAENAAEQTRAARLTLLRKVQGDYQVYAKVAGQRHPVEVRQKQDGSGSLYNPQLEYCTQDELGEERCVTRRSEVKVVGAPLPFPGASVLWWTRKTPSLKVEKGKTLLYHEAVYTRLM